MKFKLGFIFICLIICLFSIASVCAADVNETVVTNEDQSEDVITIENENLNDGATEENELGESTGTFTDFINEIQNAGDELNLNKNYSDNGFSLYEININKKITIDGKGHTIYGFTNLNIFHDYVILKNINFVNCRSRYNQFIHFSGNYGIIENCTFNRCSLGSTTILWSGENGVMVNCNFKNYTTNSSTTPVRWKGTGGFLAYCNFTDCVSGTYQSDANTHAISWNGENGILANCNFYNCKSYSSNAIRPNVIGWQGGNGFLANCYFKDCGENNNYLTVFISTNKSYIFNFTYTSGILTYQPEKIILLDEFITLNEINDDVNSSETIILKPTIPKGFSGKISIYDNNIYKGTISAGESYSLSNLNAGTHTIKVGYQGEQDYIICEKSKTITVHTIGTLNANNITVTYGSGYDFIAIFFKNDGSILANSYVIFTVNGNDNIVKTDSNGIALLNIGLGNGIYNITSTNLVTGESVTNTLTIIGEPTPTSIITSAVTTVYNGGKYLVVKLKDIDGNAINGVKLTVVLNGKTYTPTTDANGQVKVSTNGLAPNIYTASITFAGNNNYAKSTGSAKVTVTKATPKLTAKAKTFKRTVKTKKYAVTLKDNTGKVMKKVKLTLKIKGKTYKATTNTKGKATFKITKFTKKGTFKAVVAYKGNAYYNKVTKTVKIKIK